VAITQNLGISVVIPNYNGLNLLEANLPTVLIALKLCGCPYEVIITDDASTDSSVQFIKTHYPNIVLVENEVNGGFATNINRGIQAARLNLVLLLNSDIKLEEQYFKTQLTYFDLPDTFGVMGKIVDEADGSIAEACKYPINSYIKINKFKNIPVNADKSYTFYLSGANALVSREKLLQLGGFNELFSPFYQEDLDLSLRAWESGWKCYYDPQAVCMHAVSSTINKHNKKKYIKVISTRNKLLVHYFHHRGVRLYVWAITLFFSLMIRWALNQMFYYKAVLLFFRRFKQIKKYKYQFITRLQSHGKYIPYLTVKKNIKESLDQIVYNLPG
jgi:GT2 family glycosyltransferase